MASYLPVQLFPNVWQGNGTASISSTAVYITSTAAYTAVLRTIQVQANAGSQTFTMDMNGAAADAASFRLFDAYALTANVPSIFNGWWVQPLTAASMMGLKSNAAGLSVVQAFLNGYSYS